jgi:hypothetical protein
LKIKTNIVSYHTADSKPVKEEVNGTVILPPLLFPAVTIDCATSAIALGSSFENEPDYSILASATISKEGSRPFRLVLGWGGSA